MREGEREMRKIGREGEMEGNRETEGEQTKVSLGLHFLIKTVVLHA